MQRTIDQLYSLTVNGLGFLYGSAPWVVYFTYGDSGQMIGSIMAVGYRAMKPVLKKSSVKIKAGVKVISGSWQVRGSWSALNDDFNRFNGQMTEVNQ